MSLAAWLLIIAALALVVACGVFVAAETSLITVDRASVHEAAEAGDLRAAGVRRAVAALSTQLSGAQVGVTVTNLAIGFLAEPSIASLVEGPVGSLGVPHDAVGDVAVGLGLAIATAVTMVLGELIPKNLAIADPLRVARLTQGFQRRFTASMRWPIRLLNGSANQIVRALGIEPQEELRSARAPEELASLVRRSADQGVLAASTARLLERSFAFGSRTAADVLTPRVRMHSVGRDDSVASVITLARATGHSRFPVVGDSADDVRGLVHVKDAVSVPFGRRAGTRVAEVAGPPLLVPTTLELDPLLTRLREQGLQMAVVVDEYGGTAGVVTLEDLIEELVGEIADEHDPAAPPVRGEAEGRWSLSGLLRPDEIRALIGVGLPEGEVYETVAGLLLHRLGRLPVVGDEAAVEVEVLVKATGDSEEPDRLVPAPASLRVERMDGHRIDRVGLMVQQPRGPW